MSATPDVRSTVELVYGALRPGSAFALYEIQLVQSGIARVLNPFIRAFYRLFGNWNADEDVQEALVTTIDRATIVRAYALGANYVAEKSPSRN